MMTNDLYNYAPFFEKVLYRACKNYIRESVTAVEYRHIFGCVFDDDHNIIPLEQEIEIFVRTQKIIQQRFPLFQMKIIVCGLKIVGIPHVQAQIDAYMAADKITNMVTGFDMVCEEDYNPKCDDFLEVLYTAKLKYGDRFKVIMHAGESY